MARTQWGTEIFAHVTEVRPQIVRKWFPFEPTLTAELTGKQFQRFGLCRKGDKFDQTKGNKLPAGSFFFMPPKTNHFGWTEEGCVLQVHAIGPWGVVYVNPADDPRQAKK